MKAIEGMITFTYHDDIIEGSTTIALAPYEIGNTLRTETQLTRALTTA